MSLSTPIRQRLSIAFSAPPLALALLGSVFAWIVLLAAFSPLEQNFPLNDDWAFARGVFRFSHGEGIDYGGWASMPQLGQWLWACPFVWLLGASFFALRLSTIVLSWLGLWAFYDLLRQGGVTPTRAALTIAVLAFNPLFFLLQGTFMTDVPALSLALMSLALYGRALRQGGIRSLIGASLVTTLAVMTRQNTAVVTVVAAVLLGRQKNLRQRPAWWLAIVLPAIAAVTVHFWFQMRPDVRAMKPAFPAPANLLSLPFLVVHFCGLSALPLLLRGSWVGAGKKFVVVLSVLLICAGYWLLYGADLPYDGLFPYTENMLTPSGAFAGSKFTGLFVLGERPILLGMSARIFLSLLGCIGGAALMVRIIQRWRPGAWTEPLILFTILQVPFFLIVSDFYDRYLLFLLPGALALASPNPPAETAQKESERGWLPGLIAVMILGLLSVGLMHDWLAWNVARWELGRRAQQRHVNPLDIEGGVEWDGWYSMSGESRPRPAHPKYPVLRFTREWFSAIRGRYVLSFSEVKGTRIVDTEPYKLWLMPGQRRFFLLEAAPLRPRPATPGKSQAP